MTDRRNKPRADSPDRRTVKFGRTPGKFADAVNAAFRTHRKMEEQQLPKPLDMTAPVARLQGELYVPNLANRLSYEGFQFGDEIRVRVDLVKRPKKPPESVFDIKWPRKS